MDGLTPQDLEYGFPALEQGIDFSLETNCSYLDLLKYEGSNGASFHNSKGSLDDVGLQAWLAKDITRSLEQQHADPAPESCIGGLRLLFGHCTLDAVRSCRVLPFREPTFPLIEQKIKILSQFFQSMRDQTGSAFRVSNPSSNIDESHSTCEHDTPRLGDVYNTPEPSANTTLKHTSKLPPSTHSIVSCGRSGRYFATERITSSSRTLAIQF